jgi:disulfide bond formation protein DsbB
MGFALYAEHVLFLMPCPLCVLQRIAVITLGIFFLVAALHNPASGARRLYSGLLALAGIFGIVVAGRHVWMQHLPADEVPSCGPGLGYMLETLPFSQVLAKVFTGSGECADVAWRLLGLSMPEWVLIAVICLGTGGVWNNLRQ